MHELLSSWELGLLSEEQALSLEAHVLDCDACFDELYAASPVAERLRPEADEPAEVASLEPAARQPRRRLLVGSLVASFLIVVVVGVLAPWPTGRDGTPSTRGPEDPASLLALSPSGAGAVPERLDWRPVAGARHHDVRIHDSRGLLVWKGVAEAPPVELPAEARETLSTGGTYYWQVETVLEDGTDAKSPLTEFTVGPREP